MPRAVEGQRHDQQKDPHEAAARAHQKAAPGRDVRDQRAVRAAADGPREEQDQPRHQQKHGQKAAHDALRQHDAQVVAEAELHQHQRHETRDRRQGRGADLEDRLCQRLLEGLARGGKALALVLIAVREDDRVVDRERELHDHGDRVRDHRDLAEPEVRAHVQQRREDEDDEEDHDLEIAARGEQQDHRDDRRGDRDDAHHLARELLGIVLEVHRIGIAVVGREQRADLLARRGHARILVRRVEGDREERGGAGVVRVRGIEAHGEHVLIAADLPGQGLGPLIGQVRDHHVLGRAGDEVLLHDRDAAARLGVGGEEEGQVRVDLYAGKRQAAVYRRRDEQQHEKPPPFDDGGGYHMHGIFSGARFHGTPALP